MDKNDCEVETTTSPQNATSFTAMRTKPYNIFIQTWSEVHMNAIRKFLNYRGIFYGKKIIKWAQDAVNTKMWIDG